MKILLFDDEIHTSDVMKILVKELKECNYELSLVYKTDTAIEKLQNEDYDVIILDIMMPYKDHYSFDETEGGIKTGSIFLKEFLIDKKFGVRNLNKKIIIFTNLLYFEKEFSNTIKIILPPEFQNNIFIINKPYYQDIIDNIKQ